MAALAAERPRPTRFRGLLPRIVSSLVLGPLFVAAIWVGFPWIDLITAAATPLLLSEWLRLTDRRPVARALALTYALAAVVALLWLRHQPPHGRETLLWVVACVIATDTGGYFIGSLTGGARLAPSISPGKTWSGLVGAMCFAGVTSAACGLAFDLGDTVPLALTGLTIALVAQVGDLIESAAKRGAGVKNSGNLIPGHGGLLDRVDGLIAAILFVAALRLIVGGEWPWA
jgi:phosphatidate cytidylyltransferase